MKLCELSSKYYVRKLTKADLEMIYKLSQDNPMFYKFCPPNITRQVIIKDMKKLPPLTNPKDKYYIGFFQEEKLIAIMDLIINYPNANTIFIGLFMVDKERQGKGIGSSIVNECFDFLKTKGYAKARLTIAKDNLQSENFWKKNGFIKLDIQKDNGNCILEVMEKEL